MPTPGAERDRQASMEHDRLGGSGGGGNGGGNGLNSSGRPGLRKPGPLGGLSFESGGETDPKSPNVKRDKGFDKPVGGGVQPQGQQKPGEIFGIPAIDMLFKAVMPSPITLGLALTQAIQTLTGDMGTPPDIADPDAEGKARRASSDNFGTTPEERMFPSMQDNTTGNNTEAPQAANAEAVNVNSGGVNQEVGRILQQQQQIAAQRRVTALSGAQGLSSPANTAGVKLTGF